MIGGKNMIETYDDLRGKYVRGIMGQKYEDTVYLFLKEVVVVLKSKNKDYDWQDNWYIADVLEEDWPERGENYKTIGGEVKRIMTDGYPTNVSKIAANMSKWKNCVGEGKWNAKSGVDYEFAVIDCGEKEISLTTQYHNCHYPSTYWYVKKEV
jgi:hypothetical protein